MSKRHFGFLFLLLSLMASPAGAQTQGISFQAVLQQPDGNVPPDKTGMTVKLLVLAPSLTGTHCVLRSETHTGVNITNGYLNLVVGGPSAGALNDGFNPASILTLNQALDNTTTRTGLHCVDGDNAVVSSGQSYAPAAGDRRILRLVVDFSPDLPDVVIADFNLRSVPYAMNAETLNGKDPNAFLQVISASKATQANLNQFFSTITAASGNSIRWNGTSFVAFDPSSGANLSAGSVPSSALASVDWSKISSATIPANLSQIAGLSCATGKILKKGASAWTCVDETTPTEVDPTVKPYAKNEPGAGLKVASNILQLDFATTATAGKAVQANDPRLSDARDAKPHYHSYATLQSTSGDYMKYAPNGVVCTTGQTLKWDGVKWICGTDLVGSGGGGGGDPETDPTVMGFAKVSPGAGLTVDSGTNVLSVQFGTTSTTAARGDDARLSDSRTPTAHTHSVADIQSVVGAYLTYKPNNAACADGNVLKWNAGAGRWECGTDNEGDGTGAGEPVLEWPAGTSGQFMKYTGSGWSGQTLAESDVPGLTTKLNDFTSDLSSLQTTVGGLTTQIGSGLVKYSELPATCGPHQTLVFLSVGTWTCSDIDYSASRLPAASDSESGIVTTLAQSFAGAKTFLEKVIFSQDVDVTGSASVGVDLAAGQDVNAGRDMNVGRGLNVTGIASVGGLKIGLAAGLSCNAGTAGVLRFNEGDGAIEFCDGSSWTAIGADSEGGGGGGGGGGDPGEMNVCTMFPPIGMPCPDGSYYGGVFRYAQRDHKVTTVAPPGCTLDMSDPDFPIIECEDDIPTDELSVPWLAEAPSGLCGTSDQMNGRENWNYLAGSDCEDELVAPLFCSEVDDGDYYLPSIEELKHMYKHKDEIGGFADEVYWSSTEASAGRAMAIDFGGSGTPVSKLMTESAYVRCMRHHDAAN